MRFNILITEEPHWDRDARSVCVTVKHGPKNRGTLGRWHKCGKKKYFEQNLVKWKFEWPKVWYCFFNKETSVSEKLSLRKYTNYATFFDLKKDWQRKNARNGRNLQPFSTKIQNNWVNLFFIFLEYANFADSYFKRIEIPQLQDTVCTAFIFRCLQEMSIKWSTAYPQVKKELID